MTYTINFYAGTKPTFTVENGEINGATALNKLSIIEARTDKNCFYVYGNYTFRFTPGQQFTVVNSTGNNNTYTTLSSVYVGTVTIGAATPATPSITLSGDLTDVFTPTRRFSITSSTNNDGRWIVASSTYSAPNTIVTLSNTVPAGYRVGSTISSSGVLGSVKVALTAIKVNGTPNVGANTTNDGTLQYTHPSPGLSIQLPGQGSQVWGEVMLENLVHMLENFSGGTAPNNPTSGQLWWDTSVPTMKVWTGASWTSLLSGALNVTDLTVTSSLTSQGATILGDNAADTITFNAGTWTLANNIIASRTAGTVAAGNVFLTQFNNTSTGDAGGTSSIRAFTINHTLQGANPVANLRGIVVNPAHSGSALLTSADTVASQPSVSSTGNVTNFTGFITAFNLSNTGSITNAHHFSASSPTITSSGTISLLTGYNVANIGHANVTSAVGVRVTDITTSASIRGIQLSISSGSGKYNLYADGTADSFFQGKVLGSVNGPFTPRAMLGATAQWQLEGNTNTSGASISLMQNRNDTQASRISFGKSRGTVFGSNTIVQSGDELGGIYFFGADSTDTVIAGSIIGASDGTPGVNDMPGRLVFSTTADAANVATERMRIDSQGRISIASAGALAFGGASPDVFVLRDGAANTLAQRNGTTAQQFNVYNTWSNASDWERLQISWASNTLSIVTAAGGAGTNRPMIVGTLGAADLNFRTNNTARWLIDSNGHLHASVDNTYDIGASTNDRPRNIYVGTSILIGGNTGGLGYRPGAGGTVTQLTNKATAVTLNTPVGEITTNNASLAANTVVSFTLNNTVIEAQDLLVINHTSGGTIGAYSFNAACAASSAVIYIRNLTGGPLSETLTLRFALIKGATS